MRGRIYTDQKCPTCGGIMIHDERRRGCFVKSIQISRHQAVFESSSAERLESGFRISGRQSGF